METKVAITSQDKTTITGHAGRCRNFYIYTIINNAIEKKELVQFSKDETLHNVFHNNAKNLLLDVNILLTQGIGNGAIAKLAQNDIVCYKTTESNPDTAIEKLIKGDLQTTSALEYNSGCNCSCGSHSH